MPETYIPEPEPTKTEVAMKVAAEVIAGQGIVRRVLLYAFTVAAIAVAIWLPVVAIVAVVTLVLLMATDSNLA